MPEDFPAQAATVADALISVGMGLAIGAACRWFDLPLPAPPRMLGALLVVSITLGFMLANHLVAAST